MTPAELLATMQWRPFRGDDPTERNYVLSSWLRSYCDREAPSALRSPEFLSLATRVYFALYEPAVKAILARPNVTVTIAYSTLLPNTVIGFLVTEGDDVVHYVHTKKRFRRFGIGRWMTRDLRGLPAVFTHHPSAIASRLCGPAWVLDPMRRFESRKA